MRGKPLCKGRGRARGRITPAHAGKTFLIYLSNFMRTDHPRACGENRELSFAASMQRGSPPRMRGKPRKFERSASQIRITPAHAGKTTKAQRLLPMRSDHPRACGENNSLLEYFKEIGGSPPRMRGKLKDILLMTAFWRITPAHAGKTLRKWRISVVDPSPQPQSSLTSRKADASSGSQRAPCAAPV